MIFPSLFSPIQIGRLHVKNRAVMPAMHTNLGDEVEGITDKGMEFYIARARGGFGMVGVGVIDAYPFDFASKTEFVLSSALHVERHARLVTQIKAHGAIAFAQIGLRRIWPLEELRHQPKLSALSPADIEMFVDAVVETAVRAAEAGYEAIDLLGTGGGALSLFMSKVYNDRTDEWGGSEERRQAFSIAIVKGIRAKLGADFPVFYRLHGGEFVEGGYDPATACRNAQSLEAAGVSFFNVTGGGHASTLPQITPNVPKGGLAFLANAVRASVNVPVAASNRITDPFTAELILRRRWADFVSLARASLADADWVIKAERGDWDRIRPCIACNECLDESTVRERPVRCLVNPRAGRYSELESETLTSSKKSVAVVGGGCIGLQAALTAANSGHEVHLYERNAFLGGKWQVAYIPKGRNDLVSFLDWLTREAKRAGVVFHLNVEATPDLLARNSPDLVVLTTGSRAKLPMLPGISLPHVATAEQVLMGEVSLGKNVVVVGGGGAGVEVAHYIASMNEVDENTRLHFANFDTPKNIDVATQRTDRNVTLIARNRRIGNGLGPATRWVLVKELEHDGVVVAKNTSVVEIMPGSVLVRSEEDGTIKDIPADSVVICTGYETDETLAKAFRAVMPNVHIIGDASSVDHAMHGVAAAYDLCSAL